VSQQSPSGLPTLISPEFRTSDKKERRKQLPPTARQSQCAERVHILFHAGMVTQDIVTTILLMIRSPQWTAARTRSSRLIRPSTPVRQYRAAVWPSYGITTPVPDRYPHSKSPFCFQTGYALCAKRPSRPFPPPFLSPPSSSFSDPLTTHYQSQDKRLSVRGELVRGLNNGDDAVLVADNFIGVNDGVGAWATKERGHAA
jgi:hypothetical protein